MYRPILVKLYQFSYINRNIELVRKFRMVLFYLFEISLFQFRMTILDTDDELKKINSLYLCLLILISFQSSNQR